MMAELTFEAQQKENPAGQGWASQTNFRSNFNTRKKLPPFGKTLMAQRMAGQSPNAVYISLDWSMAKAFPRIVIPSDLAADELDLRFLAGLDVCIVHHESDLPRLPSIINAVMSCNPRILNALDIDEPRTTILKRGAA